MKNSKLNLNHLEVKSFVTTFEQNTSNTVKGGSYTCYPCDEPTDPDPCGTTGCPTNYGCGGGGTGGGGTATWRPNCQSMDISGPCAC